MIRHAFHTVNDSFFLKVTFFICLAFAVPAYVLCECMGVVG